MLVLSVLSAVLLSIPYLVPHCGWVALFALVPLLCMERIATDEGVKRVWMYHYGTFVLWNAFTTFWVCNATIGGGIFAILANALQMSLIFGIFRLSKKVFKGALPYLFLMFLWIAWERYYLTSAQISWPWLVLGNSLARTVSLAQWYEYLGTLGGSLWIWGSNLSIFGLMCALSDGRWNSWNTKAQGAAIFGTAFLIVAPMVLSVCMYRGYKETDEPLDVVVLQPNIDPYHKFQALSQNQQNAILEGQVREALKGRGDSSSAVLLLAPETFTNDVLTEDVQGGRTFRRFVGMLKDYPGANLLFGASSWTHTISDKAPSPLARNAGEGLWRESHNSAIMTDSSGRYAIFHKSKLVVGVEMTPYPKFFTKIDDMLGGVMGRCIGQKEISLLDVKAPDGTTVPLGCAICYESVYGEYCTGYVRKGARALAIITNDAWWGNTPGYRQHLSYASLRAIETRRDIARSANTGISAFINQRGDITSETSWWEMATLRGKVNLSDGETFFVRSGDIVGRVSSMLAVLLLLSMLVRFITGGSRKKA